MKLFSAIVVLIFACGAFAAQAGWTFKTAHFTTLDGELSAINESGVAFAADSGNQTLTWDDFLMAERTLPPKTAAKTFVLVLASGDRITGEPAGVANEKLKWRGSFIDEIQVPLKQIAAIYKANQHETAGDEKLTEDAVTLANGDTVRGIISDLTNAAIVVQSNGEPVNVPLGSVVIARFASAGAPQSRAERGIRLRLSDESQITVNSLRLEGSALVAKFDGNEKQFDLAAVCGIEQVNGPVSWLSSRPPSENVQTPFFEAAFRARMNQTISGKPIRFGEKTFARGIGVHSYSRMSWDLDGAYSGFRTQYAIDGSAAFANVTVRIKLDDKIVHEQADVIAGQLSPVIAVPLSGAKRLTLEVDYGKTYDTQDRLNWIEPALIKATSTTKE